MADLSETPWQETAAKAEACLSLGINSVYLYGLNNKNMPWEFATSCAPGGSHRLDIATDVRFTAKHPCGIEFTWSFDIEPRSANGKGSYEIDCAGIAEVLAKIPAEPAKQLREYLLDCAEKVTKRADEYQALAGRQYGDAALLRKMGR